MREDTMLNRRRFLSSTALASAGLVAGVGAAWAFSVEDASAGLTSEYHTARVAACRAQSAYHARLLANVRSELDASPLSDEEKRQLAAQAVCPLCGCRISET
jgi:hypothetical protein